MSRLSVFALYLVLLLTHVCTQSVFAQTELTVPKKQTAQTKVRQTQNPPIEGDQPINTVEASHHLYTTGQVAEKNSGLQSGGYNNPNTSPFNQVKREMTIKGEFTAQPSKSFTFTPNGNTSDNLINNNSYTVGFDKTGLTANQPNNASGFSNNHTYNFSSHLTDAAYLSTYTTGQTSFSSYTVGPTTNYRSQTIHGRIIAKPNASFTFSPLEISTDSINVDTLPSKKEVMAEMPKGYITGPANQQKEQAISGTVKSGDEPSNNNYPTNYALGLTSQYKAQNIKGELTAKPNNPISVSPLLTSDEKQYDKSQGNKEGKIQFRWDISDKPNSYNQTDQTSPTSTLKNNFQRNNNITEKVDDKNDQQSTTVNETSQRLKPRGQNKKMDEEANDYAPTLSVNKQNGELQNSKVDEKIINNTRNNNYGMGNFNEFNNFKYKFNILKNNAYVVSVSEKNFIMNLSSLGKLINYNINPSSNASVSKNYLGIVDRIGDCPILFGYDGKIAQIGETKVSYENSGMIKKIGNIVIVYNPDQSINSIGTNKIAYDEKGKPLNESIVVY